MLFAQRKATASSGCRGAIFSASEAEIGTCTLEFHFLKGERPRFCSLPHRPKSGKMQPGEGEEEARRNLNVSSFWLQFAAGRLEPEGRCRLNLGMSVDAANPRKPRVGEDSLAAKDVETPPGLSQTPISLSPGPEWGAGAFTVLRMGCMSPASSTQPAPIRGDRGCP